MNFGELGRPDEALDALDHAIRLDPEHAEAHYNRGTILAELGRSDEGLDALDHAIRLDPEHAEAHYDRGTILAALGRSDEALEALDHAIRLNPDDAGTHYNRGWILGELGRLDEALDALDHAIRLDPEHAEAHYNRGTILAELGRSDEALDAYNHAIRLDPDDAQARALRDEIRKHLGRHQVYTPNYDAILNAPDYNSGVSTELIKPETDTTGEKDKELMESSLIDLFKSRNLPESMWPDTAAELERIVNERAKAALRPKWDERGKYADLKDLSSPAFLKRVYADEIAPDGSIAKEAVRKTDPKLMAIVTAYISEREGRRQDMGEAEGLRLIAGPRGRPKRASLD